MVLLSNKNMKFLMRENLYPDLRTARAKKELVYSFRKNPNVKYKNVWPNSNNTYTPFELENLNNYGFTTRNQLFQAYLNTLTKREQNERPGRVGMTLNEKEKLADRVHKVLLNQESRNKMWITGLKYTGKTAIGSNKWNVTPANRGNILRVPRTELNAFIKKYPEAREYIIPYGNNPTRRLSRTFNNYLKPNFLKYYNAQILKNKIRRAERNPIAINTALRQFQLLYNKAQKLKARELIKYWQEKMMLRRPPKVNVNLLKVVPESTLRKRKANANANSTAKKARENANQAALNANRANRRRLIEEATRPRARNAGTYTVNNSGRVKLKKN